MIPKEDFIFNDDKLFERRKIIFFEKNDLTTLCIYFKKDNGFFVPQDLDFLEVDETFDFIQFKNILSKNTIELKDIAELIQIFDVFGVKLDFDQALYIAQGYPSSKLDFNQMYFSVS